ncbi:hypothetical protein B0H14DRAFT_2774724 [Mycena olivaceomarginata]|nr:hypothetical protein B0H14DRAFT_2774724 [Mycena olivaceomarginata]
MMIRWKYVLKCIFTLVISPCLIAYSSSPLVSSLCRIVNKPGLCEVAIKSSLQRPRIYLYLTAMAVSIKRR